MGQVLPRPVELQRLPSSSPQTHLQDLAEDIHFKFDKFVSKSRKTLQISLGKPWLDDDILAIDVTQPGKIFPESVDERS
jgi:hypothetical protein